MLQFLNRDPVAISYLFGCGSQACGAVVDPLGDVHICLLITDRTRAEVVDVPPPPPRVSELRASNAG